MASNVVTQQYPNNYASNQFQYSNLALNILGVYFPWLTSVEYNDTCDVAEGRGISPYPMGTTLGEYKASGSVEVQLAYAEQFRKVIAGNSPDGTSLYDSVFDVTASYQHRAPLKTPALPTFTDTLKGCRLTGSGMTMSAGNGVLTVKFPLYIGLIVWNGYYPVAGLSVG